MIRTRRSIETIANTVWRRSRDPRRCWMALFQAYYDASGTQSAPDGGLCVVGLVSSEEKWLKFEPRWEAVLNEFGVTAHHMKEFTGPAPKSEFAKWGRDSERRARYLAALIKATKL